MSKVHWTFFTGFGAAAAELNAARHAACWMHLALMQVS
jgi:hypothetical protein